jgi:hypothetical protein
VIDPIERRGTPGVSLRHADRVRFTRCSVAWGPNPPDYFTHLLQAEDTPGLDHAGLAGSSAHPGKVADRQIS